MQSTSTIVESLSGVRGVFGKGITLDLARDYARAFLSELEKKHTEITFVVASDTRVSSGAVREVWVTTAREFGATVYDIGATTTPVALHYVQVVQASGGVMITASHNPPEHNGWKCISASGALLAPDDMKQVIQAAHRPVQRTAIDTKGTVLDHHTEAVDAYVAYIKNYFGFDALATIRSFSGSIVVDPNGSAVYEVMSRLCDEVGIPYHGIRTAVGVFERTIEPNNESLADVAMIVSEKNAAFGCGFDCDADRVELVLPAATKRSREFGPVVSGQYVLALGVDCILSSAQQDQLPPIVVNYATSSLVRDIAHKYGADTIEVDVGEILVVMGMQKHGSVVGGEGSSSGVIVKGGVCRDGVVVVLLTILLLASRNVSLVDQLDAYPQYFELRTKVAVDPAVGTHIRAGILSHYMDLGYTIVTDDTDPTSGIKIYVDDSTWVFFRASKTEPGQYRLIVNGKDASELATHMHSAQALFESLT